MEGRSIPFSTGNTKQTVASLIRELEEQFRRDDLIRLTISTLKVGRSALENGDLLVEVLNDGDVVNASVGGMYRE